MTHAEIEHELTQFRTRLKQTIANANALSGVVQFLEQKLAETPAESSVILEVGKNRAKE